MSKILVTPLLVSVVDPLSGRVLTQIAVPLEKDDRSSRVEVSEGLAPVFQNRRVVVVDLEKGRAACGLEVPSREYGLPASPIAAATKRQVFVATNTGRVGVFQRNACGEG